MKTTTLNLIYFLFFVLTTNAQTSFSFTNTVNQKLEIEFHPSIGGYYRLKIFTTIEKERNFDTLFSALELKVRDNKIFYRSLIDSTKQEAVFLDTQKNEPILFSYTKNFIILDSIIIPYLDAPNPKCISSCSKTNNIKFGEPPFGKCINRHKIVYFSLYTHSSQIIDNYIIGFLPNIGIVSLGYAYVTIQGKLVVSNYLLKCELIKTMEQLWKR